MKKLLILLFSLCSFSAYAEESVDVLLFERVGGLTERLTNPILESIPNNVVRLDGCALAAQYLVDTNNPTIALWTGESQFSLNNDSPNPCAIPNDLLVSTYATSSYKVCFKEGNPEATLDHFLTGDIKVGAYSGKYTFTPMSVVLSDLNPNAKIIPYKSSRDYRPALQAGEVDFTFTPSVKDGEDCLAIFAPSSDTLTTIESLLPNHPFNIMGYDYYFATNNIDNPQELLQNIFSSDAWENRTEKDYNPFFVELSREEQLQRLIDYNNTLAEKLRNE